MNRYVRSQQLHYYTQIKKVYSSGKLLSISMEKWFDETWLQFKDNKEAVNSYYMEFVNSNKNLSPQLPNLGQTTYQNIWNNRKIDCSGFPMNGLVTTEVFDLPPIWQRFRFTQKHVLVFDCDDENELQNLLLPNIASNGLGRAIIESSPNRFWVITDYVGSFKEISSVIDRIVGYDRIWNRFMNLNKKLCLRAYPRNCSYPRFPTYFPVLPINKSLQKSFWKKSKSGKTTLDNTLKNSIAINWFHIFRDHFCSRDIFKLKLAMFPPIRPPLEKSEFVAFFII